MSLVTMAYSVDSIILREQAYLAKEEEKLGLKYHQDVINEQLPYTLGGAIFMSRLLMLALNKEHIGEVQISVWKDQDSLKLL